MNHLFCLGFGFTAATLAATLDKAQWRISGTSRTQEGAAAIAAQGYEGLLFDELAGIPASVTHLLCSIPPGLKGDAAVAKFAGSLARPFTWLAYLSTTGVYGDHGGGWVDEETPLNPSSSRARARALAEAQWLALGAQVFRLPGIYGPGRSQLEALLEGSARRVVKPGQVFCRIHVEDIAGVLAASMAKSNPGRIYNVADDEPCPPQDVVAFAASLLGIAPPPEVPIAEANLSPMALSFYDESKRVSNRRIKQELGYQLKYPTYREGLAAIFRNSPHLHVRQG
ncbi:MAG: SDR family oxidoreductase [Alphaproteobacteria bacterium]|nr:SDR family oxidoreductase [Alphaproteobacteria bacterium]